MLEPHRGEDAAAIRGRGGGEWGGGDGFGGGDGGAGGEGAIAGVAAGGVGGDVDVGGAERGIAAGAAEAGELGGLRVVRGEAGREEADADGADEPAEGGGLRAELVGLGAVDDDVGVGGFAGVGGADVDAGDGVEGDLLCAADAAEPAGDHEMGGGGMEFEAAEEVEEGAAEAEGGEGVEGGGDDHEDEGAAGHGAVAEDRGEEAEEDGAEDAEGGGRDVSDGGSHEHARRRLKDFAAGRRGHGEPFAVAGAGVGDGGESVERAAGRAERLVGDRVDVGGEDLTPAGGAIECLHRRGMIRGGAVVGSPVRAGRWRIGILTVPRQRGARRVLHVAFAVSQAQRQVRHAG